MPGSLQIAIKLALLAYLVWAVVARHRRLRAGSGPAPRWQRVMHGVAVVIAVLAYGRFDRALRYHLSNPHDTFHYYASSKYAQEVGYDRLYHCAIVALDELGPRWHRDVRLVRSMKHLATTKKSHFLDRPDGCKRHFTPERWAAFVEDVRTVRQDLRLPFKWPLRDKGYNATPVWDAVGRILSSRVSLQPLWHYYALSLIDLLLVAGALGLTGVTFGWWTAGIAMIWLGACHELDRPNIRGSFLRLDWLACLLGAIALLGRRWYAAAGVLLGYATMVRVFPAILLFGPGVQALRCLVATRRLPRRHLRLFGAFAVTCGVLFGASVAEWGDGTRWRDFAAKIQRHRGDHASQRVGLKYLLTYRGETSSEDLVDEEGRQGYRPHFVGAKRRLWDSMQPLAWLVILLTGAALARVLWGLDDLESLVLSFPLVFVLVAPTFYYYSLFAAVVAGLAARCEHRRSVLLVAGLAVTNVAAYACFHLVRFELLGHFLYSAAVAALALFALAVLWLDRRRRTPETPRPRIDRPAPAATPSSAAPSHEEATAP